MNNIKIVVMYPKLQVDTIAALFILKKFGESKLPGISKATVEFWPKVPKNKKTEELKKEGYLLLDIGEGIFDHHKNLNNGKPVQCLTEIVAQFLNKEKDPSLKKIISVARRDDLYGKGTVSDDSLDRAFGLSGIIMNLNRAYHNNLKKIIVLIFEIFESHYIEEEKRNKIMPEEWKLLKKNGKVKELRISQGNKLLRIIQLSTDNPGLPGFLRAYLKTDMVVVRLSSGHVNIITNQAKKINLKKLIEEIRRAEAEKKKIPINASQEYLQKQGRLAEIEEWFYDTAANTLQNGGVYPEGIPATVLTDEDIRICLRKGLGDQ